MLNKIRRNSFTLVLFAIFTTGFTAVINELTKPIIIHQADIQRQHLLEQVIPTGIYNNVMQNECYIVKDKSLGNNKLHRLYIARKNNQLVAAALETTAPDGYAGEIHMLVGADFHGKVLGVRVIEHHETPGIGDKIEPRIFNWITLFSGIQLYGENDRHFSVKKDGGDFDQFTGATITPRAVVNATKRTALFIKTLPEKISFLPHCGDENE